MGRSAGGFLSRADMQRVWNQVLGTPVPGASEQDIYELSDVQKYVVGSRLVVDMRVFYYSRAGGALVPDVGAKNALAQHVAYAVLADAPVGSTVLVITVGAADGVLGNGAISANELAGGYMAIFPAAGNKAITRRIVSNSAVGAGGGAMTVVVDKPLPVALTAVSHGECMANPYANVQTLNSDTTSVVGIPTVAATLGQYLWLQTWGPIWIAPQAGVSVGSNNREVVFRHDGSIDVHDPADPNVAKGQHAGFVLANAAGGGQGAPFIMLQITP